MNIYDESGQQMETPPDLERGWLELVRRVLVHHAATPAVQEVSHLEVMPGTEDLRCVVVNVPAAPARPAWDEYETVQVYHPYSKEELAERRRPTQEQRLSAVEEAVLELMLGGEGHV